MQSHKSNCDTQTVTRDMLRLIVFLMSILYYIMEKEYVQFKFYLNLRIPMDFCQVVNVLNGVKDVSNLLRITYQETPGLL